MFSTIPTMDQRAGILTVPVANPFTGETYAAGTPIPMTSFARKVLNELPAAERAGCEQQLPEGRAEPTDYDKFNVRLDMKFNDRLSGVRAPRPPEDRIVRSAEHRRPVGQQPERVHQRRLATSSDRRHLPARRDRRSLDARLGISATDAGKKPPVIGGPSMRELYGITGLPENDPSITGGLTPQSITGYSQLGRQATNPQFQNPFEHQPARDADQHLSAVTP